MNHFGTLYGCKGQLFLLDTDGEAKAKNKPLLSVA
jgi:hypothetical protein